MAADDVASALARVAVGPPQNRIVEIAGPDQFRLDELIHGVLGSLQDRRESVSDPQASYFGIAPAERTLLPGDDARLGTTHFADWFGDTASQAPARELLNASRQSDSKGNS